MGARYDVKTHGYAAYSNGCRCEVCRAAKAERTREYRAQARKALRLVNAKGTGRNFVPGITHGYNGYQNHACRCMVCTHERSRYDRLRKQRAAAS